MTGYDAMARVLKAEGVEFLVAFPHQTLIEASAKAGITPIICRQERAGVNMADGFSRVSNGKKFGVFTMQQGPGAENAFGAWRRRMQIRCRCCICPAGKRCRVRAFIPRLKRCGTTVMLRSGRLKYTRWRIFRL